MDPRFPGAARRGVSLLRRLTALTIVVTAAYLAFQLYIFGGDPLVSAILVIVAVVATGLAF